MQVSFQGLRCQYFMKTKTLAGIDIGTNTFRLLIAETDGKNIKEVRSERIITRLGEGLAETGCLSEKAMERGMATIERLSEIISGHRVEAIHAVATSALREARNGGDFLRRAKESTGLDIEVISEEEEAKLTFLGMTMDMGIPNSAVLVDIGGGSTEFIFVREGQVVSTRSLKLGVVYLTDRYMRNDPPAREDIEEMKAEVFRNIATIRTAQGHTSRDTVFIGTAGTITTISAMAQGLSTFDHKRIHKYRLSLATVEEIFTIISGLSAGERAERYPVLESPRLDIIVPGTLILLEIMMTFGFKEVIVSDRGLREGIILKLYNKLARG